MPVRNTLPEVDVSMASNYSMSLILRRPVRFKSTIPERQPCPAASVPGSHASPCRNMRTDDENQECESKLYQKAPMDANDFYLRRPQDRSPPNHPRLKSHTTKSVPINSINRPITVPTVSIPTVAIPHHIPSPRIAPLRRQEVVRVVRLRRARGAIMR
jgi:hypothetical protein